jgi:hypothetical protein
VKRRRYVSETLPISELARLLEAPAISLNMWRKRGLLGRVGEDRGTKKARHYDFRDALRFALARKLTTGRLSLPAATATRIATSLADRYLSGEREVLSVPGEDHVLLVDVGATASMLRRAFDRHSARARGPEPAE